MVKQTINIGLLGFGTVGTGVVKVLQDNAAIIAQNAGAAVQIKKIADIEIKKKRPVKIKSQLLTTDAEEIIRDPKIDIVVEAIGGTKAAKKFVFEALKNGKHVVTSNKELIALYMHQLAALARRHKVMLLFEASVGGGIPIIQSLENSLSANKIQEVYGILNGTTNYILTRMTKEGLSFKEALKQAQMLGFAEPNPKNDIDGHDAAYKAAILAATAFKTKVDFKNIAFEGIERITLDDVQYATNMGYVVKLLAIIKKIQGELEISVHPTLVPENHALASVNQNYNAIYIKGNAVGELMLLGQGAGGVPTASAVVSDMINIAHFILLPRAAQTKILDLKKSSLETIKIKKRSEITSRYYLRLKVLDQPGVLAKIAGAFGKKQVSIQAVHQQETEGEIASLVIILHRVADKNLKAALHSIEKMPVVKEICSILRVGLE